MLGASLCCLQTFILQTSVRGSITVWLTNPVWEKLSHFHTKVNPSTCLPHQRSWARLTALLNKGLHEASPQIHIIRSAYFQSSRWSTCPVAVLTCRNETHQRNCDFSSILMFTCTEPHTQACTQPGFTQEVSEESSWDLFHSFPLTWSTQQETTCFRHDSELILIVP